MAERNDRHFADAGLGTISGVVSSLPAGFALGELRTHDGAQYRLCYNSSSDATIDQGKFAAPVLSGAGPNSVTVSYLSKTNAHIGAVQVAHATVSTGNYFWGLMHGPSPIGAVGDAASLPTGSAFYLSAGGLIALQNETSLTSGNAVKGRVITTVSNGGAYNGKIYIVP